MIEKLPRVLITSSDNKAASWINFFAERNIPASTIPKAKFSPEPESLCGMRLGREKVDVFSEGSEVTAALLDKHVILAAMDVNGYLPGSNNYETVGLTTCRGVEHDLIKATTTAQQIIDRGDDYAGYLGFGNVCGYGEYKENMMQWTKSIYESAMITISRPLLYEMANPNSWRKILEAGEAVGLADPLLQADSSGATRWDAIADYVPVIAKVLGINAWVGWEDGKGGLWLADKDGASQGMKDEMNRHLRGFPLSVLNFLASLPI